MKIYTKTGDKGETGLFGGARVRKDHVRIEAYGEIDELNACLGTSRSLNDDAELDALLHRIQNELFEIGAVLATPSGSKHAGTDKCPIRPEDITRLEKAIDRFDRDLPALRNFILPGGTELSAALHLARTVCRRAERDLVALAEQEPVDEEILAYINRLSDLLFIMARWANWKKGISDTPWKKKEV